MKSQIPNGDFETILSDGSLSNWGNVTLFAVIIDFSGNVLQDSIVWDGPFCGVTTDAHTGNYALEMRNAYNFTANESINGWASVDEDTTYTAWGSLEFIATTIRPQDFNFFYKYESVNGDSGIVRLAFYDSMGNVVGEASMIFSGTNSSFNAATLPVYYSSSNPVVSYSLNFSTYFSMADYPTGCSFGTRLIIDDVDFSGTTGVSNIAMSDDVIIYPNPCKEYFSVKNTNASEYTIYSSGGQVIQTGFLNSEKKIVLRQNPAKGIYTIELKDQKHISRKNFTVN